MFLKKESKYFTDSFLNILINLDFLSIIDISTISNSNKSGLVVPLSSHLKAWIVFLEIWGFKYIECPSFVWIKTFFASLKLLPKSIWTYLLKFHSLNF